MRKKFITPFVLAIVFISPLLRANDMMEIRDELYPPVKIDNLVYVSITRDGKLLVIDPVLKQIIKTVDVGEYPEQPVAHEKFLYITGSNNKSIAIDTSKEHEVINLLNDKTVWKPLVNNGTLYLFTENKIYVMNQDSHEVLMEKGVCKIAVQPIFHNNMLYHVTNWLGHTWKGSIQIYDSKNYLKFVKLINLDGVLNTKIEQIYAYSDLIYVITENNGFKSLFVIDPSDNYAAQRFDIASSEINMLFHDKLIYFVLKFRAKILIMDISQNHKIIGEIKVDENPSHLIARDNLLYLSHQESDFSFKESNLVSVIDPKEGRVTKKVELPRQNYGS